MRPATDRYAYGPCSSPCAHRHPPFPHLRRCSASDPARNPAAPGKDAASRSRRERSSAADSARRLFLYAFITQEASRQKARSQRHHPACREPAAEITAATSISTSYVSGVPAAAGPRSVHATGSITEPSGPPPQLTASPEGSFRSNSTRSRRPDSGWNGWVTVTNDSGTSRSLRDRAVCGFRRDPEFPEFPGIAFRDHHLPYFVRPELASLQRVPDLAQEGPDPDRGLDHGRGGLVDSCGPGALVGGHALPRVHQERRVVDEVEQVTEPAARIFGRPAVQLGLHPPYREIGRTGMRPAHGAGVHRRSFGHYIGCI